MAGWPVVGHEWAIDLLERAITGSRLAHAYLFTGPAQVGKMTLARAFARALFCERAGSGPCDERILTGPDQACRTCQRILQGRYPDLQVISAEKNTIQIDQVRVLQGDAALSPLEGKYRVFIIREIERATLPAANALLKTLEEPPSQVILLLTCGRRDLVLPTILSRCQVIGLRSMPTGQVQSALETRWGVEPERSALLARLSAGRLGWAVAAHMDPQLWEARARHLDDLLGLVNDTYLARLAYAEALSRQPDAIASILGLWATWWRDVLLIQQGATDAIVNLDRRVQLQQQAERYPTDQVEGALTDLMQTLRRLKANVNARLALDVLTLRLPHAAGA